MSAEGFQWIDDEKIDNSIIKKYFVKLYPKSGAKVHDEKFKS